MECSQVAPLPTISTPSGIYPRIMQRALLIVVVPTPADTMIPSLVVAGPLLLLAEDAVILLPYPLSIDMRSMHGYVGHSW